MRDELQESYGHLKAAAGHAVGGTAQVLTPPYDRAVGLAGRGWQSTKDAFAPFYEQVRAGAADARGDVFIVKKRSRWPMLAGLLAVGAAVGAAGVIMARRRRMASQWDEYEPSRAADDAEAVLDEASGSKVTSATKKVQAGAAAVAESVSSQAGRLAESLNEKSGRQSSLSGNPERARDAAKNAAGGSDLGDSTFSTFATEP